MQKRLKKGDLNDGAEILLSRGGLQCGEYSGIYEGRADRLLERTVLEIQAEKLLDHLYDMYRSMPIDRFMKWGYDYCLEHESQIREHMEKAEKGEG